jgi:hypothetical protein
MLTAAEHQNLNRLRIAERRAALSAIWKSEAPQHDPEDLKPCFDVLRWQLAHLELASTGPENPGANQGWGRALQKLFASVDARVWLHDDGDSMAMDTCTMAWHGGRWVEYTRRKRDTGCFYCCGGTGDTITEHEVKLSLIGRRIRKAMQALDERCATHIATEAA